MVEPLTDEYAAAYLDGEGCFRYDKGIEVRIESTYPHTLTRYEATYGGSVYNAREPTEKDRRKFRWGVYGLDAYKVCERVLPYLIEKKPQAELLVRIYDLQVKYPCGQYHSRADGIKRDMRDMAKELTRLKRIVYPKLDVPTFRKDQQRWAQPVGVSGYHGVVRWGKKWASVIYVGGVQHTQGGFHTNLEAAINHDKRAIMTLGRARAILNFPDAGY